MNTRRTLLLVMIAILVVLGAYSGYWVYVRGVIAGEVDNWIAEQEAAGYEMEDQGVSVTGYPYRFAITVDAPQVRAPQAEGGWFVRWGRLRATASPFNFNHWIFEFEGPLFAEQGADAQRQAVRLDAERARISLVAGSDGRTRRVGLDFEQVALESLAGDDPGLRSIARLLFTGEVLDSDEMHLRLEATGVAATSEAIGRRIVQEFGDTAETMRIDMRVTEWTSLAARADAIAWRDAGGELSVGAAQLDWGPARLSGHGDFTLDAMARPDGRLSLRIADPDALAEALVSAGVVSEENAPALRTAALLAPRGPEGVALPLRLREGAIWLGPARLGSLN